MPRFLLALCFILFCIRLYAHQCPGSDCARQHLETARLLLEQDQPSQPEIQQTLIHCQSASQYFFQAQQLLAWLDAEELCATIQYDVQEQPFMALDAMKRVKNLVRQAKMPAWLMPADATQWQRYCDYLLQKAWYAKQVDDFIQVKSDVEEALLVFRDKLNSENADNARFIYLELGNAYVRLGDYDAAKPVFERGISYAREYQAPNTAKFNDYGSLFLSQNKHAEALAIFQRGLSFDKLELHQKILLHTNIAESLAHLNRYEDALAANRKAEKMIRDLPENNLRDLKRKSRCTMYVFENYGIIAQQQGQFEYSAAWFEKAIEVVKNPDLKFPAREQAGYQIAHADVYLDWGRPQEALDIYQQGLRTILPTFGDAVDVNPDRRLFYAEKMLVRALEGKARAFDALGTPDKSLECYELIPEVEKKLRAAHMYESSTLIALDESRKRFENAVDIAWKLYAGTGNSRYAERAFHLTEQARGMLLYQTLARTQLEGDLLDSASRQQEYDLSIKISYWEQEVALEQSKGKDADSLKVAQLTQLRDALISQQEQFRNQLRQNSQEYARLSDLIETLQADKVADLLRSDQALLDFFMTGQAVYVFYFEEPGWFSWLFGRKPPHWRKITLDENFLKDIRQFTTYVSRGDQLSREEDQWLIQQAHSLYNLLLTDIRHRKSGSVIIIPDLELAFIPFEMLLREPVAGNWRKNLPYLIRDLDISYAYSATLLRVQQNISKNRKKPASIPFAGLAPSYSMGIDSISGGPRDTVLDIPQTRDQVLAVNNIWGGNTTLLNGECTERAFRQLSRDCRIMLLAMHGFADAEKPELARLRFGDPRVSSGDKTDDNILTAAEIQIMRLQADLIVLSACHSGQGRLHKGEGVFSLARAFTAAGVPAAVMSQWRLQGDAANLMITHFFRQLKNGQTIDEALGSAKRDFLDGPDNEFGSAHPYYWAGLKAIGNMDALHTSDKPLQALFYAGFAATLLLLALAWSRKKRRLLQRVPSA